MQVWHRAGSEAYLGGGRNEGGGQERGGEQREDCRDLHLVLRVVVGGDGGVLCVSGEKKRSLLWVRGGQGKNTTLAARLACFVEGVGARQTRACLKARC